MVYVQNKIFSPNKNGKEIPDRHQILLYNGKNEKKKTNCKNFTLEEHPWSRLQQRFAKQPELSYPIQLGFQTNPLYLYAP